MKNKILFALFLLTVFSLDAQIYDHQLQIVAGTVQQPIAYQVPTLYEDTLIFSADIANKGRRKATNVRLTVNVKNENGTSLFSTSRNYGTLMPDSVMKNKPFSSGYVPFRCFNKGKTTIGYKITSDSLDNSPLDDTATVTFFRTDTLLQNYRQSEQAIPHLPKATYYPGEAKSWSMGMVFKNNNNYRIRLPHHLSVLVFDKKNLLQFRPLVGILYQWVDANLDGRVQVSERTLIAGDEVFTRQASVTQPIWVSIPLTIQAGQNPYMEAQTTYIAMVDWYPSVATTDSLLIAVDTTISMEASLKNYQTINRPRYFSVTPERQGSFPTVTWTTSQDTLGNALLTKQPIIKLSTYIYSDGCFRSGTSSIEQMPITISPNPSDDEIVVDMDFEGVEQKAYLSILTLNGQTVAFKNVENATSYNWRVSLRHLPTGVYIFQIRTDKGVLRKKFMTF